jgi:Cu/Ag efflux protein CusF
MKTKARFLVLTTLIVSMASVLLTAEEETEKLATQEVSGTIKEVSINVRRLTIALSERQEKIVSVEPETKIIINNREATIEELKSGQAVRLVLPTDSSKAILIEVK